jgi:hypothetical protein
MFPKPARADCAQFEFVYVTLRGAILETPQIQSLSPLPARKFFGDCQVAHRGSRSRR